MWEEMHSGREGKIHLWRPLTSQPMGRMPQTGTCRIVMQFADWLLIYSSLRVHVLTHMVVANRLKDKTVGANYR